MSGPTDAELVDLAAAIYAPPPGLFDHIIQVDPMAALVGIKHCDGYDVAVPRGSKAIDDWYRDAISERPRVHAWPGYEKLGMLPYGFSMFLPQTYAAMAAVLRAGMPLALAGHSLACPEAGHLAGAHRINGGTLARLALFEPPNPGTAILAAFLADVDISAWRNKGDPVPDLPEPLPDIFPWCPVRPARVFDLGPAPSILDPLARHHVALCQQAVQGALQ